MECQAASFSFVANDLGKQETVCLLQNGTQANNPTSKPIPARNQYYMVKMSIRSGEFNNDEARKTRPRVTKFWQQMSRKTNRSVKRDFNEMIHFSRQQRSRLVVPRRAFLWPLGDAFLVKLIHETLFK